MSSFEIMSADPSLDHSTARGLLRAAEHCVFLPEEDRRTWLAGLMRRRDGPFANPFVERSSLYSELQSKPFLRVWDTFSGSIPDFSNGHRMLARSSRGALATKAARQSSLKEHANHSNREPTPYISFTSSRNAAEILGSRRINYTNRGDQNLVVVDPRYRLQHGLPVLDMKKEMKAYGVENPYTGITTPTTIYVFGKSLQRR